MCLEMAAGERNTWEHLHAYKSIMMAMYLKIALRLSYTFFSSFVLLSSEGPFWW